MAEKEQKTIEDFFGKHSTESSSSILDYNSSPRASVSPNPFLDTEAQEVDENDRPVERNSTDDSSLDAHLDEFDFDDGFLVQDYAAIEYEEDADSLDNADAVGNCFIQGANAREVNSVQNKKPVPRPSKKRRNETDNFWKKIDRRLEERGLVTETASGEVAPTTISTTTTSSANNPNVNTPPSISTTSESPSFLNRLPARSVVYLPNRPQDNIQIRYPKCLYEYNLEHFQASLGNRGIESNKGFIDACREIAEQYIRNTPDLTNRIEMDRSRKELVDSLNEWLVFKPDDLKALYHYRDLERDRFVWKRTNEESMKRTLKNISVPIFSTSEFLGHFGDCDNPNKVFQFLLMPPNRNAPKPSIINGREYIHIKVCHTSIFEVWLESTEKAIIQGIECNPNPSEWGKYPRILNSWGGLAYFPEEVEGNCEYEILAPILNHLRYTWCDTEEEFSSLVCRFALLVQKPYLKQKVAIALVGDQGQGKGIIIDQLLGQRIIGKEYYYHCMSQQDIVGHFNAQLIDKVLVFADENESMKDYVGIMKALITEDEQRERKMFQDTKTRKSFLNVVLASNNLYSTPQSSANDRRFFVLHADSTAYISSAPLRSFQPKETYFQHLQEVIQSENVQKTFFHFLYRLPLNGFNPQVIPMTRIGAQSALNGISREEKWWSDCLLSKRNTSGGLWKKEITATELYHCFLSYVHKKGKRLNAEDLDSLANDKAGLEMFLGKTMNMWPTSVTKENLPNTPGDSVIKFPDFQVCKADWVGKYRGFQLLTEEKERGSVQSEREKALIRVDSGFLKTCFLPIKTGKYEAREEYLYHVLRKKRGDIENGHSRDFLAREYTCYYIKHGYHLIQGESEIHEDVTSTEDFSADLISKYLRVTREQKLLQ